MKTIPLTKGHQAIVDDEDYDALAAYPWHAYPNKSGVYACRTDHSLTSTKVRMHRQIMGLAGGRDVVVDHINGNTLDNRRTNLRACAMSENCRNKHRVAVGPSHSTGILGVRMHRGRYRASIRLDGRHIVLGTFDSIVDAIKARREGELKHWGQYAPAVNWAATLIPNCAAWAKGTTAEVGAER